MDSLFCFLLPVNRYFTGIACGSCINVIHTAFPNDVTRSVDFDKFILYLRICGHADIVEPCRIYAYRRSIVKQRSYCFCRIPTSEFGYAADDIDIRPIIRIRVIYLKTNRYLSTRQNIESGKSLARYTAGIRNNNRDFPGHSAGNNGFYHAVRPRYNLRIRRTESHASR